MKIRNGFVSNSSSSSFVVNFKKNFEKDKIPNKCFVTRKEDNKKILLIPNKKGKYEFGWEFRRTKDIISKINYATILAYRGDADSNDLDILKEAIYKEHPDVEVVLDEEMFNCDTYNYAYIDHESLYNSPNLFKSKESVYNFIFNKECYIQGGNDNENPTKEYKESLEITKSDDSLNEVESYVDSEWYRNEE